jgi:hypothetical protein
MHTPDFDPLKMLFDLQLLTHELAQANLRQAQQIHDQQEHLARLYQVCDSLNSRQDIINQQVVLTQNLVKQVQKSLV